MRLTILGGGGFRVPLVYRALLTRDGEGAAGAAPTRNAPTTGPVVDEVVLHDVDEDRLTAIGHVLDQLGDGFADAPRVRAETDLDKALAGADFVFSAMRVGGLAARRVDESAALTRGVLGQETTGPGGISLGLRTLPVAMLVARRVAAVAPEAWVINFTNPVGMVTEAMSRVLGDRVIGICDTPSGLCRRVARALDVDPRRAWFDYFGLNHLGWLRGVHVGGRNLLPALLSGDGDTGARVASFEEGRLFGADWLRALGAVPNEYLSYFYFNRETVRTMRSGPATRAAFLADQQAGFYATVANDPERAFDAWDRAREEREATYMAASREASGAGARDSRETDGGGYERIALSLMAAIAGGDTATLILDVRNSSAVPVLDPDAVVEVPCVVNGGGARPVAVGDLPDHAAGLMRSIKGVDRAAIEAAATGSREAALRAMALHPLVGSVAEARHILEKYIADIPELSRVFTAP